jgi:hypothetical protein
MRGSLSIKRRFPDDIFLLPRLRGRIEEGEARVARGAAAALVVSASPILPSPASGGGNLRCSA